MPSVSGPEDRETATGVHHKYGTIGAELPVEGEPMEEHVVTRPRPAHLATVTGEVEQVQGRLAGILQGGGDVGELLHTKVQAVLSH